MCVHMCNISDLFNSFYISNTLKKCCHWITYLGSISCYFRTEMLPPTVGNSLLIEFGCAGPPVVCLFFGSEVL